VSACVGAHRIPGEPVAVGEDVIDLVNVALAAAGRRARAERRLEDRARHGFPPFPPAGEAFGLAGEIIEGRLEGLEPAVEARRADHAIGGRRRNGHGPGPQVVDPGIRPEEKDARRMFRVFHAGLAQLREILPRIAEPEGGRPASAAFGDGVALRHGTRGRHLHHKAARRDDDQAADGGFGGPENAQHGEVNRARQPRNRGFAGKLQHGEKSRNDGVEGFALAFDDQVPVHGCLSCVKNKTGTLADRNRLSRGYKCAIWGMPQFSKKYFEKNTSIVKSENTFSRRSEGYIIVNLYLLCLRKSFDRDDFEY
jgi:hypothetical protein